MSLFAYLDSSYDPTQPLLVIADYVQQFFGCRRCAHHFQMMASFIDRDVTSREDAVLWLWQAHNQANGRLAGTITEDPQYPKVCSRD